jgi:hypothetical protein
VTTCAQSFFHWGLGVLAVAFPPGIEIAMPLVRQESYNDRRERCNTSTI